MLLQTLYSSVLFFRGFRSSITAKQHGPKPNNATAEWDRARRVNIKAYNCSKQHWVSQLFSVVALLANILFRWLSFQAVIFFLNAKGEKPVTLLVST